MADSANSRFSYLKRIFLVTHAAGLGAGAIFPFLAVPILGRDILTFPFFIICLLMGFGLGASLFFFVRATFKQFLRRQVDLLAPLARGAAPTGDSEEELLQTVESVIGRIETIVGTLFATVEELAPHYRNLSRTGQYLHDRAHEGLSAAVKTHEDVKGMEEKQQEIAEQMEILSGRTQDEAALSRELSASLEEMAGAMEISTAQFLETTSAVDEVASTVREAAAKADDVARSVEETSKDLDRIGDTLEKIRTGASASAQAVDEVKKDAGNGLLVVKASMEEMERIEQESRKATEAMERLSSQTGEVVKIIEVIRELVSDTELLAFNAAIIAAKAGEEGKGFSVVAEEIRDLAVVRSARTSTGSSRTSPETPVR